MKHDTDILLKQGTHWIGYYGIWDTVYTKLKNYSSYEPEKFHRISVSLNGIIGHVKT